MNTSIIDWVEWPLRPLARAAACALPKGRGRLLAAGAAAMIAASAALVLAATAPALAVDDADAGSGGIIQVAATAKDGGRQDKEFLDLQQAAKDGQTVAQWKLAKIYAEGKGVTPNPLKAFEYFRMLANQHADANPLISSARYVSESFVRLADYYLAGIPDSPVVKDTAQALSLLRHAATYFGDAEAQYRLGRMYLQGAGVSRNHNLAAKWLMLAARKGNVSAQAELGVLLYHGAEGVTAQPERGLMFLEMARRGADPVAQSWVIDTRNSAFAAAGPDLSNFAVACADNWPQDASCTH
ncbi:MAG TPA: tetratricopeptide repeat protein [Hyphomicrobiales bacterium]|nr:tetratricopeptide repeat protein [Hyphomicrobiales bacterium]